MTTRLLLIGDIHLREGEHFDDSLACLAFATKVAQERDVDFILVAGDVFEGKSTPAERDAFGDILDSLGDQGIVHVIRGNHDQSLDLEVYNGYEHVYADERPELYVDPAFDLLTVPWPEKGFLAANGLAGEAGDQAGSAALAAMLRGTVATREHPERPLVVLAHLQVLGAISSSAQPLIGKAIEATLGDLQDLGAAAVVLGHVHKPQQLAPGIEYVGSLTVHDFGEEAEQKRVGILTVEDDGAASWEWIPVLCRRWVTIEAKVTESGTVMETSIAHDSGSSAKTEEAYAGWNVRYRYTCTEEEQHLFDHAELERRFAGAHTLKIVPQVERAERVRAAEVAAARSPEEKLHAWGAATGVTVTESHVEKLHQLREEIADV